MIVFTTTTETVAYIKPSEIESVEYDESVKGTALFVHMKSGKHYTSAGTKEDILKLCTDIVKAMKQ